jgi:hypothetical protein
MTPQLYKHLENYLTFYYEYLPQIRATIQQTEQIVSAEEDEGEDDE